MTAHWSDQVKSIHPPSQVDIPGVFPLVEAGSLKVESTNRKVNIEDQTISFDFTVTSDDGRQVEGWVEYRFGKAWHWDFRVDLGSLATGNIDTLWEALDKHASQWVGGEGRRDNAHSLHGV